MSRIGLHAERVTLLHDRHHKVSSSVKVHQNARYSVTYEVIWKWQNSVKYEVFVKQYLRAILDVSDDICNVLKRSLCVYLPVPGKPTNLQVTSVHDLTINLTWTKPLTTVGTPVSTSLLYRVSYTVIGSGNQQITLTGIDRECSTWPSC